MLKDIGNIAQLMQQAKGMQDKMSQAQSRIAKIEATGRAGGDMIVARVNTRGALLSLKIDPMLLGRENQEVLSDLIIAAVNHGQQKAKAIAKQEMNKVTGDLNLPPGFELPFSF